MDKVFHYLPPLNGFLGGFGVLFGPTHGGAGTYLRVPERKIWLLMQFGTEMAVLQLSQGKFHRSRVLFSSQRLGHSLEEVENTRVLQISMP